MTEQQSAGGASPAHEPRPVPPSAPPRADPQAAVLLGKVGEALRGSTPAGQAPRSVAPDEPGPQRHEPDGAPAPGAGPGAAAGAVTGAAAGAPAAAAPRPGAVARPAVPRAGVRPPAGAARQRRARLRLRRIDPWSVFVLSLLVSLFLAVVLVVAVVALYAVLEAAGVPDSVNALVSEVTRSPGETEPAPLLSAGRALTTAGVVAVVDVVLLTALATLSAVLYNLCAGFTGGLEVTLAEEG